MPYAQWGDPAGFPVVTLHGTPGSRLGRFSDPVALAATGIEYVAIVPFTSELAAQSADEFVDHGLLRGFRMRELLIGHDHGFGRGREGDVDTLRTLGETRGFGVHVVAPVQTAGGQPISSSLIRRAVSAGQLTAAAASLGRNYSVSGTVVPGESR